MRPASLIRKTGVVRVDLTRRCAVRDHLGMLIDSTATQPSITASSAPNNATVWSVDAIEALFDLPFNDLLWRAQTVQSKWENVSLHAYAMPTWFRYRRK